MMILEHNTHGSSHMTIRIVPASSDTLGSTPVRHLPLRFMSNVNAKTGMESRDAIVGGTVGLMLANRQTSLRCKT